MKLSIPERPLFGQYTINDAPTEVAQFRAKLGGALGLVFTHQSWIPYDQHAHPYPDLRSLASPMEGSSLSPLDFAAQLGQQGTALAVSWSVPQANVILPEFQDGSARCAVHAQRVIDGYFDQFIGYNAYRVAQFGKPIMIGLSTEMDVRSWFAYGADGTTPVYMTERTGNYATDGTPDGPARVRDMYKHIISIFDYVGADNVSWFMYARSHYMDPTYDPDAIGRDDPAFFLDDELKARLSFVGNSAYFIDPAQPPAASPWYNPTDLSGAVANGYAAWSAATDLPMFLPEFGIGADPGVDKSAAIRQIGTTLAGFPKVKAFSLLDSQNAADLWGNPRIGDPAVELSALRETLTNNPQFTSVPTVAVPLSDLYPEAPV